MASNITAGNHLKRVSDSIEALSTKGVLPGDLEPLFELINWFLGDNHPEISRPLDYIFEGIKNQLRTRGEFLCRNLLGKCPSKSDLLNPKNINLFNDWFPKFCSTNFGITVKGKQDPLKYGMALLVFTSTQEEIAKVFRTSQPTVSRSSILLNKLLDSHDINIEALVQPFVDSIKESKPLSHR